MYVEWTMWYTAHWHFVTELSFPHDRTRDKSYVLYKILTTIFRSSLNISTKHDYKCSWELHTFTKNNKLFELWILLVPAVTPPLPPARKLQFAASQDRITVGNGLKKCWNFNFSQRWWWKIAFRNTTPCHW